MCEYVFCMEVRLNERENGILLVISARRSKAYCGFLAGLAGSFLFSHTRWAQPWRVVLVALVLHFLL